MAERTSAASAPKAGRSDQTPPLQHDDDKEDPKGKKPMVKKRTKTGCLSEFPPTSRTAPCLPPTRIGP